MREAAEGKLATLARKLRATEVSHATAAAAAQSGDEDAVALLERDLLEKKAVCEALSDDLLAAQVAVTAEQDKVLVMTATVASLQRERDEALRASAEKDSVAEAALTTLQEELEVERASATEIAAENAGAEAAHARLAALTVQHAALQESNETLAVQVEFHQV